MPKPQITSDGYAISIYEDRKPTSEDLKVASSRLWIAFPKMKKEFFVLLSEFVLKENFTAKRLEDAVNHVIANFQYKELNVSDIIKFDKKVKLYTYNEVCLLVTQNKASFENFEIKKVDGKTFRVKKTEL